MCAERSRTYAGWVRGFLIAVGIVVAVWAVAIAALWIFGRKLAAKQLARTIPDLVALTRGLIGDPRVPFGSKVLVAAALLWLISPIDWSRSSSRCWVRSTT
jgi:hypothetical protein